MQITSREKLEYAYREAINKTKTDNEFYSELAKREIENQTRSDIYLKKIFGGYYHENITGMLNDYGFQSLSSVVNMGDNPVYLERTTEDSNYIIHVVTKQNDAYADKIYSNEGSYLWSSTGKYIYADDYCYIKDGTKLFRGETMLDMAEITDTLSPTAKKAWRGYAQGDGKFVAVYDKTLFIGTNPENLVEYVHDEWLTKFTSITYMNGMFILGASNVTQFPDLYILNDDQSIKVIAGGKIGDFYKDGYYYTVSHATYETNYSEITVKRSKDLINWTIFDKWNTVEMGFKAVQRKSAFLGDKYILALVMKTPEAEYNAFIFETTDMKNWKPVDDPTSGLNEYYIGTSSTGWGLTTINASMDYSTNDAEEVIVRVNDLDGVRFICNHRYLYADGENVTDEIAQLIGVM